MLLNYDFLEFENDKKVRVIDDKLCVNILDFFGIGDEIVKRSIKLLWINSQQIRAKRQ